MALRTGANTDQTSNNHDQSTCHLSQLPPNFTCVPPLWGIHGTSLGDSMETDILPSVLETTSTPVAQLTNQNSSSDSSLSSMLVIPDLTSSSLIKWDQIVSDLERVQSGQSVIGQDHGSAAVTREVCHTATQEQWYERVKQWLHFLSTAYASSNALPSEPDFLRHYITWNKQIVISTGENSQPTGFLANQNPASSLNQSYLEGEIQTSPMDLSSRNPSPRFDWSGDQQTRTKGDDDSVNILLLKQDELGRDTSRPTEFHGTSSRGSDLPQKYNSKQINPEIAVAIDYSQSSKPIMGDLAQPQKVTPAYQCSHCGRVFSKAYNRTIHERTHTDERPFGCKVCSRRFRRKDHLRDHSYTHLTSKPFVCLICNRGFCQSRSLENHKRTNHPVVKVLPSQENGGSSGGGVAIINTSASVASTSTVSFWLNDV